MIHHKIFDSVKNKSLLDYKSYINGKWLDSQNHIEVINPFNQKVIAKVTAHGEKETELAINSANQSFASWKKVLPQTKSNLLRKWYNLILENTEDIAYIMTVEQGKPLADARAEITYGASFVEWFAEEAKKIHGDVYPLNKANQRYLGIKEPLGVVAAITPWNFPMAMIIRKIAPALAAGCSIILKPAMETPLTAIALIKLAQQAGFPDGVINLILGGAEEIGACLTASNIVKKLSFTGSTEIGKLLYQDSANTLKKLSLELGGNAPLIIFGDANLELAAEGLVNGKARNTGQACTSINRVYINEKIYENFLPLLIEKIKRLKIGNGLENEVNQGPLINQKALEKIKFLIKDALSNGAKIIYQAENTLGGLFFPPTIIQVEKENLAIEKEEIFGPIIVLYKFHGDDKAIVKRCNDTNYGLAAYFYTESRKRIWEIAEELEYGMIGINETLTSNAYIPFGGIKYSGFGREGSIYGIEEYLTFKYYCFGDI